MSEGGSSPRVLVVGDSRGRARITEFLGRIGLGSVTSCSTTAALTRLAGTDFDLVFVDHRFAREKGRSLLRSARRRWPGAQVVPLQGRYGEGPLGDPRLGFPSTESPGSSGDLGATTARPATPGPRSPRTRGAGSLAAGPATGPSWLPQVLGMGRVESAPRKGRDRSESDRNLLRIEADDVPPRLLGRLLIGGYITGQDRVVVSSPRGLTPEQRAAVQLTAHRVLGMSVVEDARDHVEVQSFLDPAKYAFLPLLERMVWLLRAEIELCRRALGGANAGFAADIEEIEEGVDRLYLLMVRQLMLSAESPSVARKIRVRSHHYQMGDRLVAKVLEVVGDLLHAAGTEVAQHLDELASLSPEITRELVNCFGRFDATLARTTASFLRLSPSAANALLDEIAGSVPNCSVLGDGIARQIPDRPLAIAAQRVVWNLIMGMDMLVIINEVTINRAVETRAGGGTGSPIRFAARRRGSHPRSSAPRQHVPRARAR